MPKLQTQRVLSRLPALALFAAVVLPLGLWRLGATDIVLMEGIVADGARYMTWNDTYLVPRLHSEIYAYKPPFAYWLALMSTHWLGEEAELTLRLPFALSGMLMALAVLLVVSARLGSRVGLTCGLASVTGILAIQKLRIAEFDMPLAAGVGIASTLAISELTAREPKPWRWPVAYLALCLAFLAKGIPALMFFFPGLTAAVVLTGSLKRLLSASHLCGVLAFLTGSGAWIAGAWFVDGWAAFEQLWREAEAKGLTWSLTQLGSTLVKPAVLLGAFFPWTLALPPAVRRRVWQQLNPEARAMAMAAGGFVVGGLVAFMAVPATETRYLLPLAAPLGILCGILLRWEEGSFSQRAARGAVVFLGLLLVVAVPWLAGVGRLNYPPVDTSLLMATGAGLIALAGLIRRLPLVATLRSNTLVLALAAGLGIAQILAIEPHRASSRSQRDLARTFRPGLSAASGVWVGPVSGGFHHSSLVFYLRQPVRTFSSSSPPPDGALAILFSDEPPGIDGQAPFNYAVLEAEKHRGVHFELVRVIAPPSLQAAAAPADSSSTGSLQERPQPSTSEPPQTASLLQ